MGLFDYRIGALLAISAVRTAAFAPALLPPSSSGTLLRESVVEQDEAGINDGASIASSPPSPGLDDDGKFECDDSVRFWRDFQVDGFATAQENARSLAEVSGRFANLGPDGLSYWVRHLGRTSYFATNAVLGSLGFQLSERLANSGDAPTGFSGPLPFNMDSAVASRLVLEAAISYEQDYERIRSGDYREPWDMVPGHRQSSPINVVTQTGRFIQEAIGTLGRRARMREADKEVWISDSDFAPGLYPDYYKNAFHYQTDGWMSRESADVYETSTETLFLGRQDSMQRTSLPALLTFARKKINEEGDRSSPNRPLRVLEVACGTGRFMTFVRDNLPLRTKYTAVDLSPFYLDAARENDSYWRKTRRDQDKLNRGAIEPARLIQAQAENLPFEDESFDAVVCVYLFHELPRKVREQAAAEMARVVAPGGAVIFTDSIQRGDRPALDEGLNNFEKMNEPYYVDYSEDDLSSHFEKAGLKPKTKIVMSTTKSLSFEKPEE